MYPVNKMRVNKIIADNFQHLAKSVRTDMLTEYLARYIQTDLAD